MQNESIAPSFEMLLQLLKKRSLITDVGVSRPVASSLPIILLQPHIVWNRYTGTRIHWNRYTGTRIHWN
jgi:hypothetical protein